MVSICGNHYMLGLVLHTVTLKVTQQYKERTLNKDYNLVLGCQPQGFGPRGFRPSSAEWLFRCR